MEKTEKQFYEAPSVRMIEVRQESIICVSDPDYNKPFDPEEDW